MSTSYSPQQHLILLRQKVFDLSHQLQLAKIQNENLTTQVAELKQKQKQQKQINDMLVDNLNNSQLQMSGQITLNINGEFLTQRIQELEEELERYKSGVSESVDRRVKKIVNEYTQEKELEYEKKKSRLSMGNRTGNHSNKYFETHQHKYFNIEYKTYTEPTSRQTSRQGSIANIDKQLIYSTEYQAVTQINNLHNIGSKKITCQGCFELEQLVSQKDETVHKLNEQLRIMQGKQSEIEERHAGKNGSTTDEWKLKYLQTLKLYENLKQEYDRLLHEYNNLIDAQPQSQTHSDNSRQSYTITQSPINGFKKKILYPSPNAPHNTNPTQSRLYTDPKDRQELMLQEITNLVNGMARNKKPQSQQNYQHHQKQQQVYVQEKKSRVSYAGGSRISQQPKLDGSQFTIKEGVNRYGQNNGLF